MKRKICYYIDHVYSHLNLEQNCWIHNKDWLSSFYEILFVVRTLESTHVKYRANFKILCVNNNEPYERVKQAVVDFKPDIMHIFGPFYLGTAGRIIVDMYGKCKIVQQYGGGQEQYYWNQMVDVLIVDKVHEHHFGHVPKDRIIVRNNCCDLDFYKPIANAPKQYDCIMAAGFYASKGQDVVLDILKDEDVSVLFLGSQKSNIGEPIPEFVHTMELRDMWRDRRIKPTFIDFGHPKGMPAHYSSAKIFVWGSRMCHENPDTLTNRSVTEAVACGLPFVAFEKTFHKSNFVINGYNAILVNTDYEFKCAVMDLLKDDVRRSKMAQESRDIAEAMLDFKVWHDELMDSLYKKILR